MSVNQHLMSGVSVRPENGISLNGQQRSKIVWISLKLLCFRDTPLPALYGYQRCQPLLLNFIHMCIHVVTYYEGLDFGAFY